MSYATCPQDDEYRRAIVVLILAELKSTHNQEFSSQAGFAGFIRAQKTLLKQLFGGQGIQRLARVVAWVHREHVGRRDPPEVLCYMANLFAKNIFEAHEPILSEVWHSLDDVLIAAMLDRSICAILMRPMTGSELESMIRTILIVAVH